MAFFFLSPAPPPLRRAPVYPPPRAARTAEPSLAAPAGPPPLPPCTLRRWPQWRGAPTSGWLVRRSLAASWELFLRHRGRAVDPPPSPGREPRRFVGAAPGLAPCRPLIGASGRPLGREARRPSAALGAHGRWGERRRERRRSSAREGPGRERGSESRGHYHRTAFPFGPPRPPGPTGGACSQSVREVRGV